MASVDTAAPTDGGALRTLDKLDKNFRATHALKLVIGKRPAHGADVFLFDEPTVGADAGAEAEIDRPPASLLAKGAGVIMVSSSLLEVYELAGALRVFPAGRIVASYGHEDASWETILTEAIGV